MYLLPIPGRMGGIIIPGGIMPGRIPGIIGGIMPGRIMPILCLSVHLLPGTCGSRSGTISRLAIPTAVVEPFRRSELTLWSPAFTTRKQETREHFLAGVHADLNSRPAPA